MSFVMFAKPSAKFQASWFGINRIPIIEIARAYPAVKGLKG